jgi:acyl-CoA thioester hydrolase
MTEPPPPPEPARAVPASGSILVRVRYCECDPMGVAHHAAYAPWLEMARTELLREAGVSYRQLEAAGVFLVITKLQVRYRRPVRYDDVVEVRTRVVGGSRVKIRHEYEIVLAERGGVGFDGASDDPSIPPDGVLSAAETELACVGPDGRVRPLPDWLAPGE